MDQTPESLAADMLKAAAEAVVGASVVVAVGANNIKKDARASVYRTAPIHNAHAAESINYDKPEITAYAITSEIGYDLEVSKSANIVLEYGGGGDHSPPHRDVGRALDNEAPGFEKALLALTEKLL
jgi:hypothetical protein